MTPIRTMTSLLVVSAILAAAPAAAATNLVDRNKLESMAETAKTPKDHIAVAKQYRLQAEQFEQRAAKHEEKARELESAPRSPMAYKWPAMAGKPWVKERQLAMEARRAARECLEASDQHMRLSMEKLAEVRASQSKDVD